MIVFPNAKINLGLNVVDRRHDGYHSIQSVFFPIPFSDILEFDENINTDSDELSFSGIPIPGNTSDNLCVKALSLLRKNHSIPPLKILLHKAIPMGAGLGGGSSDGAAFLKALNEQFELRLADEMLKKLAMELGSDCPFFIENMPVVVSGKGEIMHPIKIDLSGYYLVLIFSDVHISTAEAYANLKPKTPDFTPAEVVQKEPIEIWKNKLTNDFEKNAFAKYPSLKKRKERLYNLGAVYASMTGSGSAIYGIFKSKPDIEFLKIEPENFWLGLL